LKSEADMSLRDILEKLVEKSAPILLSDSNNKDWDAGALLERLSEPMLRRRAYFQPGLYIAEINDGGYLGTVLFKVKQKA
jgi:hypothetical protein